MDNFSQMRIFFIISSVGFVVLFVFVAIFLYYLASATKSFSRIVNKAEKDIESIGDTTKEMLEDMRDSVIFNFLFKGIRRKKKEKKGHED